MVIYFLGAIVASVVTTYVWFHLPDPAEFTPFRAFVVAYANWWLLAPTLAVMLATPRRDAVLRFTALVDSSEATRKLLLAVPHSMFAFFMLAALPVGYVCWLVLRGLSLSFEMKKFSDMQLLADTWWLIAFFWICADWSTEIGWWGLLGLLGFVAYRATVAFGLALLPIGSAAHAARDLLLLRVFGYTPFTSQPENPLDR